MASKEHTNRDSSPVHHSTVLSYHIYWRNARLVRSTDEAMWHCFNMRFIFLSPQNSQASSLQGFRFDANTFQPLGTSVFYQTAAFLQAEVVTCSDGSVQPPKPKHCESNISYPS
ncbi:hypothetical protein ABZP36_023964 [Zizania latifolia]